MAVPMKDLLVIAAMNLAARVGSLIALALVTALAWYFDTWMPLIGLAGVAVGLLLARVLARNYGTFQIQPDQEPALTGLIDKVVAQQNFPHRLTVRVISDPECSLSHQWTGLRRGFVLDVGWPMLVLMSADEITAMVTHELAHSGDLGTWRARAGVAARNQLLEARIELPVITQALLRSSRARVFESELAADAASAAAVGPDVAASALLRTAAIDELFSTLVEHWCEIMTADGEYPSDLFETVETVIDDPHVAEWLAMNATTSPQLDDDVRETHPTIRDRIARLGASSPARRIPGMRVNILHAVEIGRWCLETVFDPEENELRPASILSSRLGRFDYDPGPALADLKAAAESPDARAALESAAAHIEADTWREFTYRLDEDLENVPPEVKPFAELAAMVNCIGTGLIVPLVNAGWRRGNRWLNQIVESPDGDQLNVFQVVEDAISSGDSSRLRGVIDAAELGGVRA